jgi:hypothetical protein
MHFAHWRLLAVAALLAFPAAAQAAEPAGAMLSGTFRDWFVYRAGEGESRVCYALSQPRSSDPANAQRGDVAFLVSTWPAANKLHEPSVVPGYPYGADATVQVEVDGETFDFGLVRNEGDEGGAWMQESTLEARLIAAMKDGNDMVVTGTSERGTLTRDTYSLAGITAALESVEQGCN